MATYFTYMSTAIETRISEAQPVSSSIYVKDRSNREDGIKHSVAWGRLESCDVLYKLCEKM